MCKNKLKQTGHKMGRETQYTKAQMNSSKQYTQKQRGKQNNRLKKRSNDTSSDDDSTYSDSDSSFIATDDDAEFDIHEYRKLLSNMWPSKYLDSKIQAGEKIKKISNNKGRTANKRRTLVQDESESSDEDAYANQRGSETRRRRSQRIQKNTNTPNYATTSLSIHRQKMTNTSLKVRALISTSRQKNPTLISLSQSPVAQPTTIMIMTTMNLTILIRPKMKMNPSVQHQVVKMKNTKKMIMMKARVTMMNGKPRTKTKSIPKRQSTMTTKATILVNTPRPNNNIALANQPPSIHKSKQTIRGLLISIQQTMF